MDNFLNHGKRKKYICFLFFFFFLLLYIEVFYLFFYSIFSDSRHLAILTQGHIIGEREILENKINRTMTVKTTDDTILLYLHRNDYLRIFNHYHLERFIEKKNILYNCPLFHSYLTKKSLDFTFDLQLQSIYMCFNKIRFKKQPFNLLLQGSLCHYLYIIINGNCNIIKEIELILNTDITKIKNIKSLQIGMISNGECIGERIVFDSHEYRTSNITVNTCSANTVKTKKKQILKINIVFIIVYWLFNYYFFFFFFNRMYIW
jgi:CRP-like cAMP-binding protein